MRSRVFISLVGSITVLILSIMMFRYYHPTHYQYNDRFIIGNTVDNIIEKYGEFSKVRYNDAGEMVYGTYMIRDNTPEWIMGYDDSLWYEIYFEEGIAVMVRLQEGWYGG